MIRNYLLVALRLIRRTPGISAINIGGLAIGMAATLIIVQYVAFHLGFDHFYNDSRNIYRLGTEFHWSDSKGDQVLELPNSWEQVAWQIAKDFPEIIHSCYFQGQVELGGQWADDKTLWLSASPGVGQDMIKIDEFITTDSAYFQLFNFEVRGSSTGPWLAKPDEVIISKSLARNLFGHDSPVGKLLYINGEHTRKIVGVYHPPANTTLRYPVIFARGDSEADWYHMVFFKVQPGTDIESLRAKLATRYPDYYPSTYRQLSSTQAHLAPIFQPIVDIHFDRYSNQEWLMSVTYPKYVFYVLLAVGFIISAIALANYFNLTAAQLIARIREVGVRKVMGATAGRMLWQFLIESMLVMMGAFLLALTLGQLTFPYLTEMGLDYNGTYLLTRWWFVPLILVVMIFTSSVTALFKYLLLRGISVTSIFKGTLSSSKLDKRTLQNVFMTIQFVCTAGLIIGMIVIHDQVNLLLDQDLGYTAEQTMVINAPTQKEEANRMKAFFNMLKAHPMVNDVTASLYYPSQSNGQALGMFYRPSKLTPYGLSGSGLVEPNFTDFYDIEIVAGRSFRENYPPDTNAVLLSEHALRRLEFEDYEDALNAVVMRHHDFGEPDTTKHIEFRVIGIFKDYYIEPLHRIQETRGLALFLNRSDFESPVSYYSVKMAGSDIAGVTASIGSAFNEFFPKTPFNSFILDEAIGAQYARDQLFRKILTILTGIAIIISALGLFALTSILLIRKTREIGIRKVLGASMMSIFRLFAKSYTLLVAVAGVTAMPLTWYVLTEWLNGYAVRITLSWPLFVLPVVGLGGLIMGLLFFQVDRVSKANPCESLRYE